MSAAPFSSVIFGTLDRRGAGENTRVRLIQEAIDLGLTTLDTAPLYEFGNSEQWLGRALKGRRRDHLVVATKVGLRWDDDFGQELFRAPHPDGGWRVVRKDSRPVAVRADVEGSLQRTGLEVLDLVQVHHPDADTPIEDTIGELLRLKDEGKLRAIGVSNYSVPQCERALRTLTPTPLSCIQVPYSLIDRGIENHLLPWALDRQVPVFAYSPLAEGILAGKYLREPPSWDAEGLHHPRRARAATHRLQRVLEPIAANHGVSAATLALAALRSRAPVFPIVGASRRAHLEDAARAMTLELSAEERRAIDEGFRVYRVGPSRKDRLRRKLTRVLLGAETRVRRALSKLS